MTLAIPPARLPRQTSKGEPTWEIAYLFPTQGNWTVAEYFALDTNWLVEFSDGVLEVLHTADEPQPPAELVAAHPEVTWEVAYLFPTQGYWTVSEYMALRPNRQVEYSDGFIEVLPVPRYSHQKMARILLRLFEAFVFGRKLGEIMFAPLRIELWDKHYREPDIVFMKTENLARCKEEAWEGADLALEIVSEDRRSRERDLNEKREEYATAGIPEYWVVDPAREVITVFQLQRAEYTVHGEFKRGEQATSVLLAGFAVDVAAVFDAGKV